jgi:hypothetical protein
MTAGYYLYRTFVFVKSWEQNYQLWEQNYQLAH